MVSFNCDGCGDVVKKPKLAQHYNRCYAPFTCLDCSVQFATPKDAHTSCITEDEKYQKSLYKGKKKGGNQPGSDNGAQSTQAQQTTPVTPALVQPVAKDTTLQDNAASVKGVRTETNNGKEDKKRKRDTEDAKEKDTKKSKPAKKSVGIDSVKSMTQSIAKKGGKVPFSDIVKQLAKNNGLKSKAVKKSLLKKLQVSVLPDGTVQLS